MASVNCETRPVSSRPVVAPAQTAHEVHNGHGTSPNTLRPLLQNLDGRFGCFRASEVCGEYWYCPLLEDLVRFHTKACLYPLKSIWHDGKVVVNGNIWKTYHIKNFVITVNGGNFGPQGLWMSPNTDFYWPCCPKKGKLVPSKLCACCYMYM